MTDDYEPIPIEQLRPLRDNLLIQRAEPRAKTAGGIVRPDVTKETRITARVLRVGPEVPVHQIAPGQRILLGRYAMEQIGDVQKELGHKNTYVVNWNDILLAIDDNG